MIPTSHEEMIRQYPIAGIVEGWYFSQKEDSPGHFHVEGCDIHGHRVSKETSGDPDRLLTECIDYARQRLSLSFVGDAPSLTKISASIKSPRDNSTQVWFAALVDAVAAPFIALLIQAIYVVGTGWTFRNAYLRLPMEPLIVFLCLVCAVITHSVLKPLRNRRGSCRWVFWVCVSVFSAIAIVLSPRVAE